MKRGWFGPKRFGWGASPASWEGWLATLVFLLVFCGTLQYFQGSPVGWVIALTIFAVFLGVVARTYRSDARTPL